MTTLKIKYRLLCAGIILIVFAGFLLHYFDNIFNTIVLFADNSTHYILQYPNSSWESTDGTITITVASPDEYGVANFALLTYNDGAQIHEYGIVSTTYGACLVIEETDEGEASRFFRSNPPNIGTISIFSENDRYMVMRFSESNDLPPYYDSDVWPWKRFICFNRVDE